MTNLRKRRKGDYLAPVKSIQLTLLLTCLMQVMPAVAQLAPVEAQAPSSGEDAKIAQDKKDEQAKKDAKAESQSVERVTVTGSRINRAGI